MSISSFLDLLLPRSCLLCGADALTALCPGCMADLPALADRSYPHCCPVCALPLAAPATACGDCLRAPPAFDATRAALRYTHPVDHLVQMLKFGHRLAAADFFAERLLALPLPAGEAIDTVIIPVPLSSQRLRERGFNQAVEIARPLARALKLPLELESVARVRDTLPQSALPWAQRQRNLRHAFECRADFTGRAVIVVDDVMTTGATLGAVAQTLKDHGTVRVTNLVAARAVKTT